MQMMIKDVITETLTAVKPSARDSYESMSARRCGGTLLGKLYYIMVELEMNDVSYQYLYTADGLAFLLNPKTLEEISLPIQLVSGGLAKVVEGGTEVKVRMSQEKPILVHSPQRTLKCTVAEVLERRDGKRRLSVDRRQDHVITYRSGPLGDRKSTVVQVQGGARVSCPGVVEVGDRIVVSIDDHSYQGKAL